MLIFISIPVALLLFLYIYHPAIFSAMSEHSLDWLQEKAIGWSHTPPVNKIDTHHHCVPQFYAKGKISISAQFLDPHKITLPQRLRIKEATQVAGQLPTGARWLQSC